MTIGLCCYVILVMHFDCLFCFIYFILVDRVWLSADVWSNMNI